MGPSTPPITSESSGGEGAIIGRKKLLSHLGTCRNGGSLQLQGKTIGDQGQKTQRNAAGDLLDRCDKHGRQLEDGEMNVAEIFENLQASHPGRGVMAGERIGGTGSYSSAAGRTMSRRARGEVGLNGQGEVIRALGRGVAGDLPGG